MCELLALFVLRCDNPVIGRQHPQIADYRFGNLELRTFALNRLGQHQVDPVAREYEPGDTGQAGYGNGDGAHARAECSGQEAAITRCHERALGERLAGGDRIADNGTGERVDVGAFLHEIGVFDQILRPWLEAETVGCDDRAHGQGARCNENFLAHHFRFFCCHLRRGSAVKHVLGEQSRDRSHHQRTNQQNDFLLVHDVSRLLNAPAQIVPVAVTASFEENG